jgi:hypothetical protein
VFHPDYHSFEADGKSLDKIIYKPTIGTEHYDLIAQHDKDTTRQ